MKEQMEQYNIRIKGIYGEELAISQVANMKPNKEYIIRFAIKQHVFGIKEVNDYIFKYGLFIINDKVPVIIANSDNMEFLTTYAITHFAVSPAQ